MTPTMTLLARTTPSTNLPSAEGIYYLHPDRLSNLLFWATILSSIVRPSRRIMYNWSSVIWLMGSYGIYVTR